MYTCQCYIRQQKCVKKFRKVSKLGYLSIFCHKVCFRDRPRSYPWIFKQGCLMIKLYIKCFYTL